MIQQRESMTGVVTVSDPLGQQSSSSSNKSDSKKTKTSTKYDSNNYDVKYHPDAAELEKQGSFYDVSMKNVYVKDQYGNIVSLPYNDVQGNITYYQPGSFTYGPTSYVPYYEDSVLLSLANQKINTTPTYLASVVNTDFCEFNKSDPEKIESICNTLSNDKCTNNSCCVLLGGQKCVAGNERGPSKQANYSDVFVLNKDFYQYRDKCYGNCPVTSKIV
jgi:hypothetical protein